MLTENIFGALRAITFDYLKLEPSFWASFLNQWLL
jgi:hypothetical protein